MRPETAVMLAEQRALHDGDSYAWEYEITMVFPSPAGLGQVFRMGAVCVAARYDPEVVKAEIAAAVPVPPGCDPGGTIVAFRMWPA